MRVMLYKRIKGLARVVVLPGRRTKVSPLQGRDLGQKLLHEWVEAAVLSTRRQVTPPLDES